MTSNLIAAILWLSVAASVCVYGWRLYRHVVHHETRHDRAARRHGLDHDSGPGNPPAEPGSGPTTPPTAAPVTKASKRPRGKAPDTASAPIEDGALVREVIRQELAKKQSGGEPTPLGPATDDPSGDGPTSAGRTGMFAKPRRSVAELIAGVKLPCDLTPLVDRDEIDPNRAVFATAGYTPATVARAMADELERLGFRIDTVSDTSAVARKSEGDLHLTIHDDLADFPTAPRAGVVVELTS